MSFSVKNRMRASFVTAACGHTYVAAAGMLRAAHRLPSPGLTAPVRSIFFSFPYHSVGDTVLSLKLLDRIHAIWPDAAIDFAVGRTMASVITASSLVRRVIIIPRSPLHPGLSQDVGDAWFGLRAFSQATDSQRYDLAIAPRWEGRDSYQAASLAYASGAPVRCGYDSSQSGGYGIERQFLTQIVSGGIGEHESLRFMRLLGRCGLDPLGEIDDVEVSYPIQPLIQIVERYSGPIFHREARYAVLAPGATNPMRMWPAERFAAVGEQLQREHDLQILIAGAPGDRHLCESIAVRIGPRARSLAGATDLLQLIEVIAHAAVVVCNDSGPGHIAGGLGVLTIVINPFPSSCTLDHFNSPSRFRPCGPQVRVLQPRIPRSPCTPFCSMPYPHCIEQINVEDVMEEILQGGGGA